MRKIVILRAPLLSISGYGVHSRQIFRWLMTKNVDVVTQIVPWGTTSWEIDVNRENGLIGQIMERSQQLNRPADLSIQVQLPNEWDPNLALKNIGVSAFVETDICNPEWIACSNQMDHVIVPTEHTKKTILRTGHVYKPLSVIPEAFFDDILDPDPGSFPLDGIESAFNFLIVGQITGNNVDNDRKNLFRTLKWLIDSFSNDPSVGIILKTNSGQGTTIDRAITSKVIKNFLDNERKGDYPKVHLVHGNLSTKEMSSIYRHPKVSALVSLTRGEGFGLPLLEATASDLPVIATNWSGHLDFLSRGRFIPINYRLSPIHDSRVDNKIFMKGSQWAEPDERDFKKKIVKFRKDFQIPRQWAKDLGVILRNEYSQSAINQIYDQTLGHFLT